MELAQIIVPEQVVGSFCADDKQALLRSLAVRAAQALKRDPASIIEPLLAREKLGSTGIGRGVALPHAYIKGLTSFFGAFVRLQKPIDFEAVDGERIDLVFLLLSPEGAGKQHLSALAAVTRRLRDAEIAATLRETRDPIEMYAQLTGKDASWA